MHLIAAPHIAGLLPARVRTTPTAFCYSNTELSTLPDQLRAHLFAAAESILDATVGCLQRKSYPYELQRAALHFADEIASLITSAQATPLSPARSRYRTRQEMDAEVQGIVTHLHERIADICSEVHDD